MNNHPISATVFPAPMVTPLYNTFRVSVSKVTLLVLPIAKHSVESITKAINYQGIVQDVSLSVTNSTGLKSATTLIIKAPNALSLPVILSTECSVARSLNLIVKSPYTSRFTCILSTRAFFGTIRALK
jgi:hypothetical protein